MSLTGSASAEDRAAIIRQAESAAKRYYGTECVGVGLRNEQTETVEDGFFGTGRATVPTGYTADWTADIKHSWWEGSYGRTECRHCKARPS